MGPDRLEMNTGMGGEPPPVTGSSIQEASGGIVAPDPMMEPRPMSAAILARLLPILVDKLNISADELLKNPDTRIVEDKSGEEETLGASSLQGLRTVNAVEKEWKIKVPASETRVYRTLRSIVYKLEEEDAKKAAAQQEQQ